MFKKILSSLICSLTIFPMLTCAMPVSAADTPTDNMIIGEWMWGSTIASLGDDGAEIVMTRCAEMGITDVYLLVKGTGGKLGYLNTQYKDALSRTNRDVLQEAIDAAHPLGIRVHAWICNVQDSYYKAQHNEAGLYHYIRGYDNDYICLYDEGYQEYMMNIAAELAAYDIDGLHFDYVRYNHLANGWSDEDFSALAQMGANIDRVQELVETTFGYYGRTANSNYIFNAYKNGDPDALIIAEYRKNNVRDYAKAVIDAAKAVNPNLIISAATMPEGAYDEAFALLHYGQSYKDAAALYDYICPMAYSTTYGKNDSWVATLAKQSIDMGNKVVMGLQAYDKATSARMMTEIQSLRTLMSDKKYGNSVLGAVIFRTGTVDYAKLTYDTQQKTIAVKVFDTGNNLQKIQIECKNGIKILEAETGSGIDESVGVSIASDGSTATISGSDILCDEHGYVYLKYEGDIADGVDPAMVRVYRSSEICTYTVCYDVSHLNADIGTPPGYEPIETKPTETEATETEPAETENTETEPMETESPTTDTTDAETIDIMDTGVEATTATTTAEPVQSAGCRATAKPFAILSLLFAALVLRKKKEF
ncbi:MAG: family 10 glycosylhydrolase [Clostridia bacterium]|nr:family 10 glycosylhydrolase [Clostridia bacterium]